MSLDPFFRVLEDFRQLGLARSRHRGVHVLPFGKAWQRHQDRLVPGPRRVEAELGATVVDQVELGVVASTNQLPLSFGVPCQRRKSSHHRSRA